VEKLLTSVSATTLALLTPPPPPELWPEPPRAEDALLEVLAVELLLVEAVEAEAAAADTDALRGEVIAGFSRVGLEAWEEIAPIIMVFPPRLLQFLSAEW
jgi:hypothetical protein